MLQKLLLSPAVKNVGSLIATRCIWSDEAFYVKYFAGYMYYITKPLMRETSPLVDEHLMRHFM